MRTTLRTAALCLPLLSTVVSADPLTLERVFASPGLAGKAPIKLKFSPDGTRVTYLQGKAEDQKRYESLGIQLKGQNQPFTR